MSQNSQQLRSDFAQAMAEAFGSWASPPVAFEAASAQECCEVIWSVIGPGVTPRDLAALSAAQIDALSEQFGAYFDVPPPPVGQITAAIAGTLARWPVGSLGE